MHEQALYRDLRSKLCAIAGAERSPRIARVRLWVGALAHVSEAQLRLAWPDIVRGTPAEGAGLDVEVSRDLEDARAQGIVLTSLDVPRERYLAEGPGGE